jgi:hypothetical protein
VKNTDNEKKCTECSLKAGIAETEEMYIARQRLGRQVTAATNTQATTDELLGTIFSVQAVQSGYKEELS